MFKYQKTKRPILKEKIKIIMGSCCFHLVSIPSHLILVTSLFFFFFLLFSFVFQNYLFLTSHGYGGREGDKYAPCHPGHCIR